MRPASPLDYYKQQATALQQYLAAGGTTLKRTHALEAIARIHGFEDFHTLSFIETRSSQFTGVQDVTKHVRKNPDDFDLPTDQVLLALNSPDGLYAAIRTQDEVMAVYLHENDFGGYRTYCEGDAFASQCPARILSLLSPTDDPNRMVWREAGWIHALRERVAEIIHEYDTFSPWRLLHAGREIDGYHPRYAAHVAAASGRFSVSDGKSVRLATPDKTWLQGASYLELSTENPLNNAEHVLRPGAPWKWIQLGEAPFRVWVLVSQDGGFYSWTANPFHFESAMPGLMWPSEESESEAPDSDAFAAPPGPGLHDGSTAVLERAARGDLNKGPATFDHLLACVLAGHFDPAR